MDAGADDRGSTKVRRLIDRPVWGLVLLALLFLGGAIVGGVVWDTLGDSQDLTRPDAQSQEPTSTTRRSSTTTTMAAAAADSSCAGALRAVADAVDLLGSGVTAARDLNRAELERVTRELQNVLDEMRRSVDRCTSATG